MLCDTMGTLSAFCARGGKYHRLVGGGVGVGVAVGPRLGVAASLA
jgi:hypothetical protein